MSEFEDVSSFGLKLLATMEMPRTGMLAYVDTNLF